MPLPDEEYARQQDAHHFRRERGIKAPTRRGGMRKKTEHSSTELAIAAGTSSSQTAQTDSTRLHEHLATVHEPDTEASLEQCSASLRTILSKYGSPRDGEDLIWGTEPADADTSSAHDP